MKTLVICLIALATPAFAQDVAVNVGALQVRNLPDGENLGTGPFFIYETV